VAAQLAAYAALSFAASAGVLKKRLAHGCCWAAAWCAAHVAQLLQHASNVLLVAKQHPERGVIGSAGSVELSQDFHHA
jgi:uncharacterized membrane protein